MMIGRSSMPTALRLVAPALFCLPLVFCASMATRKPVPPPLRFPLHEDGRLEFDGELNRALQSLKGKIYFSTSKGLVYAIDGAAKKIAWKATAKDSVFLPPAIDAQGIVVRDAAGRLYGLSLDGQVRWEKTLEAPVSSGVSVSAGKAYIGTEANDLIALDVMTGNEVWRMKAGSPIRTSAVFWLGRIIFGTADGKLYVLLLNGKEVAVFPDGGGVVEPLFVDANRLYCSLEDGTLNCLRLPSMRRRWKVKTGGVLTSLPATDEKRIYFMTSNSILFCLNKKSGALLWWHPLPSRNPYSPAVEEGMAFAAAIWPTLLSFNKMTGEKGGTYGAGQDIRSGPFRFGDSLLISLYNAETERGTLVFLKGEVPKEEKPVKK
jgi:outer membrane protein assembly factor BamB